MAERYIKQFDFTNDAYLSDCPIALEKGAVLLDTKTNSYLLQLKFANIGGIGIVSARIDIEALDCDGNPTYPEITANYDDPTAVGESFGTKKLIPIPDNSAISFRAYVVKVVTVGGVARTFSRDQFVSDSNQVDITAVREEKAITRQAIQLNTSSRLHRPFLTYGAVMMFFMTLSTLANLSDFQVTAFTLPQAIRNVINAIFAMPNWLRSLFMPSMPLSHAPWPYHTLSGYLIALSFLLLYWFLLIVSLIASWKRYPVQRTALYIPIAHLSHYVLILFCNKH